MNKRESNFELLRMLAGMAVVILHFNYHPSGGGALENATGVTRYALLLFEILSIGAVNIYILISGYFSYYSRKIKLARLAELLLQTICIALAVSIVSCIKNNRFEVKQIVGALIPVNYFVILYITLMFLAPFINKLMDTMDRRGLSTLILIVFVLFSVYSTCVDILKEVTGSAWAGLSSIGLEGSMNGYSIVNFVMVYMIGAWIRRSEIGKRIGLVKLVGALLCSVVMIMAWRFILPETAWTYNNPVVILEACVIFLIFGKIRLSSGWINSIAPASFTCYLIHGSILGALNNRISVGGSLLTVLLTLLATVSGIYLISIVIMNIWNLLMRPVRRWLETRLPSVQVE